MSLESSLQSIPFFRGLTDDELAQLAGVGHARDARAAKEQAQRERFELDEIGATQHRRSSMF